MLATQIPGAAGDGCDRISVVNPEVLTRNCLYDRRADLLGFIRRDIGLGDQALCQCCRENVGSFGLLLCIGGGHDLSDLGLGDCRPAGLRGRSLQSDEAREALPKRGAVWQGATDLAPHYQRNCLGSDSQGASAGACEAGVTARV